MKLYLPGTVAAMDAATMRDVGIPGFALMERAGSAAAEHIVACMGAAPRRTIILCGPGNNGGDGYVVGRWLLAQGWQVEVIALGGARAHSDAAVAARAYEAVGGQVRINPPLAQVRRVLRRAEAIVDALYGIGLDRAVEGEAEQWIREANAIQGVFRVALDVPSGVDAATGEVHGRTAFQADATVTFGVAKTGLYIRPGATCCGQVSVAQLGFGAWLEGWGAHDAVRVEPDEALAAEERFPRTIHKGQAGRVWVVGGSPGMPGAPELAGYGALRAGAGLVTVTTAGGKGKVAEVMSLPVRLKNGAWDIPALQKAVTSATGAIVVGPGLGHGEQAERVVQTVLRSARCPTVVDADALTFAARQPRRTHGGPAPCIYTPHAGEAARMLDCEVAEVEAHRKASVQRLQKILGGVVLLKGPDTLVSDGQSLYVCDAGTPALATGGSGDVLAGAIAALCARGWRPLEAAARAAYFHGLAGQILTDKRQAGWLAREIADAFASVYFSGHASAN